MFHHIATKTKIALLTGMLSASFIANANDVAYDVTTPQINAQTYILMDYNSGSVLAALNPDQRQYPASLTKMMTSYVVGQALKQGKIHSTDMVTIGESAWGKNFPGSSKMFLNLNQQVSVADLNRGIIIVSGNDACVAMAEHISGNTANFIESMNKYVRQFGLKNTNFTTVHGLDEEGQYSSARDMAIIGSHIIHDLLWDNTINVDGMKTGHTDKAGYNLVASATNPNNMRLISVVMGVPTYKGREVESKKLLQWGFANFETFKTLEAGKPISEQRVYYGDENNVQLGVLQDGFITIPKGKNTELKARYELDKKYLEAPLAKGQVVGKVVYQLDGKDVASLNLQVMQEVKEAGILGRVWDWLVLTIKSLFS